MKNLKIEQHPSSDTTPETFCAMLAEQGKQMKHIACVVLWDDDTTEVFNTKMKNSDIAWLRYVFDQDFRPDE